MSDIGLLSTASVGTAHRLDGLLPVVEDGDHVFVLLADGNRQVVTRHGQPISAFTDGWKAEFLYVGSGGLFVLHLSNIDGQRGSWFLDSRLDILPSDFENLPEEYKAAGHRSLEKSLDTLFAFVLAGVGRDAADLTGFLDLHDQLTHHLLRQRLWEIDPGTVTIALDGLPGDAVTLQPTRSGNFISVPLARMRPLMNRSVLSMAPDIIRAGTLAVASIVDGATLTTSVSICLSNFVFLYRFIDDRHDLPFLLIASTHVCKVVGIYFPLSNECFVMTAAEGDALRSHCPHQSLGRGLRDHILLFGQLLVPYVNAPSRPVKCLCWHGHLGHHLWQDLTGLATLDRVLTPGEMPEVMMMGAARSEMFGCLESIFPSLAGRVDRACEDVVTLIRTVYAQGICLISPAGHYITRKLSRTIIDLARTAPELDADRQRLRMFRGQRLPIIVLGLRVENRTVVDFPRFCADVADFIAEATNDRAVLVIDGHNTVGKHVFESAGQDTGHAPMDVERQIASDLQERFSSRAMVILSTIGLPMASSIFWSDAADFFITPWGAGLAKYKWVANKPGLVLAGRLYQTRGYDLGIYHSPEFMEDPLSMTVIDIQDVEDVVEDLPMISINEPQRINFRVNMDGVRRKIVSLLAANNAAASLPA